MHSSGKNVRSYSGLNVVVVIVPPITVAVAVNSTKMALGEAEEDEMGERNLYSVLDEVEILNFDEEKTKQIRMINLKSYQ